MYISNINLHSVKGGEQVKMSGIINALADLFIAMDNTYIPLPSGGSVKMTVLCFGLPILVAAVGLLTPWGDTDTGGEDDG